MRIAATLTLVLLLPCGAWAQRDQATGTGHFDGWPSSPQWGADRRSFEATTVRVRKIVGLLTVARNGFGWRRAFTNTASSFFRWEDISAWCSAPGTLVIRIDEDPLPIGYYDIGPEDLSVIVDAYLRRFAGEPEVRMPEPECTTVALRLPDERDKIVELLKAASAADRE